MQDYYMSQKGDSVEKYIEDQLALAGVKINGQEPWDIRVNDKRFYSKLLTKGSLGMGESYMDSWIDCDQLDEAIFRILSNGLDKVCSGWLEAWLCLQAMIQNLQSKGRALEVGKLHYDIGNELFALMLDKRMCYSCGYWRHARDLNEAQEAKLELVCKKIGLEPGMRVLDIGCGWGSFAKYAAEKYRAEVVGITISQKQLDLAKELCQGFPIELRFQDYRDVNEKFDRVISIGQMEHVGYKNYRTYMQVVDRCLKDQGLFLLHTIGSNVSSKRGDAWLEKYIFPNGMLPSIAQLAAASEDLFVMEDWHNFGADYDKTLMAWYENFNRHWNSLKDEYDQRFYRMWRYYLLTLAGSFRSRRIQLWQVVFSKHGVRNGYLSIR